VSIFGAGIDTRQRGDKGLSLGLMKLLFLAWQDPELRKRLIFVLSMFGVFALGVHIQVPIPGVDPADLYDKLSKDNMFFALLNSMGGGAIRHLSILSLGLNPYITSSIVLQIYTQASPALKAEMKEGGEYARRRNNARTRLVTLALCLVQSWGLLTLISRFEPSVADIWVKIPVVFFWTAGAMFQLWLGEQITERGIGNGISMMIFAGIVIALPQQFSSIWHSAFIDQVIPWWKVFLLFAAFVATTWLVVLFTTAQRRIPIQTARRQVGNRAVAGQVNYLPLSVNTAGVIPIIFAVSLLFIPNQFAGYAAPDSPFSLFWQGVAKWLNPVGEGWAWLVGSGAYVLMIFGFSYFYTAIQYNVEDIADNLKRSNAFIPGVRPGAKTRTFLDGVISRVTIIGAFFLAVVALAQYWVPVWLGIDVVTRGNGVRIIGGTTLLIVVTVALETMRQIEANILMKQYGS
jgi:preprotein translocase subunit SecY